MINHKNTPDPKRGFTLVELLIGLSILSIVLAGVVSATITSSRMFYRIMADADINQEIRFMEGQLARDVREATSVSMDDTSSISISTSSGTIDYFVQENEKGEVELVREDQAGDSEHTILQDISSVEFAVPDYSVTVVEMTIVAYVDMGATTDVERTFFSRYTSRVSRL